MHTNTNTFYLYTRKLPYYDYEERLFVEVYDVNVNGKKLVLVRHENKDLEEESMTGFKGKPLDFTDFSQEQFDDMIKRGQWILKHELIER